jgi:acyl-homoserine lactone acylase PvdQ
MEHTPAAPGANGITAGEVSAAIPEFASAPPPAPGAEGGDDGSNMWAISRARSATGNAMLFINPHVGFFGGGQRYEAHLHSSEGLDVSGFAILGTPYIRSGFNRRLGWSHTNNYADTTDVYLDRLEEAESWTDSLRVKAGAGFETLNVRFRKTRHGPVVGIRDGKALVLRTQSIAGGAFEQRWAMARSRTLAEFKRALSRMGLTGSNTMYADRSGNIYYVHGNAIPRRDPKLDWTKPVDGGDPAAEWNGLHSLAELPQVENPPGGWIQNCNSAPWLTTSGEGNPDAAKFPAYMAPEKDTPRSQRSRAILDGARRFSFEEWARAALDTKVGIAAQRLPEIFEAYDKLAASDPARAAALADLIGELRTWDHVARVDSIPTTLFVRALMRNDKDPLAGLEQVRDALASAWGTWRVPWGEVNRLQRIHTAGEEPFDDSKPSLPVPGAPSSTGTVFTFSARPSPGQKRWYGTAGNTYVAVIEFGRRPRAQSLLVFGQSADPKSPHHFDQAPLYSGQRFKPAWMTLGQIKKHLERKYRP